MKKLVFRSVFVLSLFAVAFFGGLSGSFAAGEVEKPPKDDWTFKEIFGSYDRGELQRGFQVYKEVCAACHGLNLVRYGKLTALGFTEAQIKVIAQADDVPGPQDDEGMPTERPAELSDHFKEPYPNENAARAANNGSLPPDLSLLTKSRKYGVDYMKALLLGYEECPADFDLSEGMYYNIYFSGHQIGMPAPLTPNMVEYSDGTPASIEQMAHDVSVFLAWAAEPELEERKQMGVKVLLFLLIFGMLMFFVNRRTWQDVKK